MLAKCGKYRVPVAQWESIVLAAQRLWVQFPGNTHTDKKMYSLNAMQVALDKSIC